MVGRGKIDSGFKPRFNPKTTKGEKRKRNVTFWANLNQVNASESLLENTIEQADIITTPEKGQNIAKNDEDKGIEEKMDRSPEAKRKKDEVEKEGNEEEHDNSDSSWCEEDLNEWDTYIHTYQKEENATLMKCIDCDQVYPVEFDNSIKNACYICKVNDHGCIKEKYCNKSKGYVWLCSKCKEIIDSNDLEIFQKLKVLKKNINGNVESKLEGGSELKKMDKKNTVTKVDNIVSPNDRIVLNYHDTTIRDSDMSSLDGHNWLNDPIISFWLEHLNHVVCNGNTRLLFVSPAVTQLIKIGDVNDIPTILDPLGARHKEYIFLPVNDNVSACEAGGSHWSLLVFSKQDAIWYHFNSQRKSNNKDANQLVTRLNTYLNCDTRNSLVDAICTQQDNSYDCGAFMMLYAQMTAQRAIKNLPLGSCNVQRQEATNMRNTTRNLIKQYRNEINKKTEDLRKGNDKEVIDLENDDENKQTEKEIENKKQENPQNKREKVCWYWQKDRCNKGESCWYKHPKLCETQLKFGECKVKNKPCEDYHTAICRNNMRRERCEYGSRCRFRHINKEENLIRERYNERNSNEYSNRNPQYIEHHSINQQRNDNWNRNDNKWKQDNYTRNEHNNANHQSFLGSYPKQWDVYRQMEMMMGNVMEEMAKRMCW